MTFAIHLPPYSQKVHLLSIARDSGVYANESRYDLPRCTHGRRGIVSDRRRNADSHLAKGYKVGEDPCFRATRSGFADIRGLTHRRYSTSTFGFSFGSLGQDHDCSASPTKNALDYRFRIEDEPHVY
jgi:hypothetical protein